MIVYMHAQSFLFIKNVRACMCIIFLTNSRGLGSHCRLTVANSIFLFFYIVHT